MIYFFHTRVISAGHVTVASRALLEDKSSSPPCPLSPQTAYQSLKGDRRLAALTDTKVAVLDDDVRVDDVVPMPGGGVRVGDGDVMLPLGVTVSVVVGSVTVAVSQAVVSDRSE